MLMGTSKNALFPRQQRQLRTGRQPGQILMYCMYTAVFRALLPCSREKITIFRGTLFGYKTMINFDFES